MGGESSKQARELYREPASHSPREIKASPGPPGETQTLAIEDSPGPHIERRAPGGLLSTAPANQYPCPAYRPVHQPFLKMGPARGRVLYILSTLQDDPVHQLVLQVRIILLLDLLLHLSA